MTQPDDNPTTTCPSISDSWANIPEELRDLNQWVVWTGDKVPLGSSTDRRTWSTFGHVLGCCATERGRVGLGFVFAATDPYVGVDLDHCLDEDGEVCEPWAEAVLELLPGAYVERSPSGTGLHLIVRGALPGGLKGKKRDGVEVYAEARYFTMTGWMRDEGRTMTGFDHRDEDEAHNWCGDAPPGALEQILHEFCGWKPTLGEPTGATSQGEPGEASSITGSVNQPSAFEMVADPLPPGKLLPLLGMDAKLKATWEGRKNIRGDDSATEASLAALVADYGFSDQEIVDTCRCCRMQQSAKTEKAKERRLYVYLLALVKRDAVEERGMARLEELGTPGAADVTGTERQVETMTALNEVLGLAPETGVEGLWRFPGETPTYAIKAVGQDPRPLGTAMALETCKPLFAAFRDLFGIHKKGVKAAQWAPICQALLDAVVEMDVPESKPQDELLAFLVGYLDEQTPVGKEDEENYHQAHKVGAPLLDPEGTLVNSGHIHAATPEHMHLTWRTPTAIGRTLAGMGLQNRAVFVRERKKNYWRITQTIRLSGMNDTSTYEHKA